MDVTATDNPIIDDHAAEDWGDEAEVGAQESEEVCGAVDEEPGDDGPDEEVTEDLTPDYGEVIARQKD